MTIHYPENRKEVADRIKTDFQNELPASEPFLRNSFLSAFLVAIAGRLYDLYLQIKKLQVEMFPDTATGEFADRWASFKKVDRLTAVGSKGFITILGTVGILIPTGTELQSSEDGIQYTTLSDTTITANSLSVTLIRSGQTVTATTASEHHLYDGMGVIISGADQIEYNVTTTIVVTSATTFTYDIIGTPVSPATGTIICNATFASVEIKSATFGSNTNLDSGAEITFSSLIAGVNNSAFVQYGGIVGGTDDEDDEDYRNRYLDRYRNPVSFFNDAEIIAQAKLIAGVTRVFVEDITPTVGQVTIYFTRDNDTNVIPTPDEVLVVKAEILKIKPASDDPADIIVAAPTPVVVNFDFATLDPDTNDMRQAITASLTAMFKDIPIVSENLSQYAYLSAIYQTVDASTGKFINSFSLTAPIGDITIADGELAILGTINFP